MHQFICEIEWFNDDKTNLLFALSLCKLNPIISLSFFLDLPLLILSLIFRFTSQVFGKSLYYAWRHHWLLISNYICTSIMYRWIYQSMWYAVLMFFSIQAKPSGESAPLVENGHKLISNIQSSTMKEIHFKGSQIL